MIGGPGVRRRTNAAIGITAASLRCSHPPWIVSPRRREPMEAAVHQPIYELFFVLEPLSARASDLVTALRPLAEPTAPEVRGVDVYYRAASDVALLAIRYDERTLTRERLSWIIDLAAGAGIPLLDPARMAEPDRRNFYRTYLTSYEVHVENGPGVFEALVALAERTGLGALSALPRFPSPTLAELGAEAADTPSETPLPPLPPGASRGPLGKLSPRHQTLEIRGALPLAEQARMARSRALGKPAGGRETGEPVSETDAEPRTEPVRPGNYAMLRAPEGSQLIPRTGQVLIDVRFLRGGQWTPARLRALSVKGAYLVTGAPPRLGDSVHVALGFHNHGALIRGTVYHVTSAADAMSTGSAGFALRFPSYASPGRSQLVDLLTQARAAGVTIKPPPPRAAVRFPVCWPVQLSTPQGGFSADAMDVSKNGLFVATNRALHAGDEVTFGVPLDDGDAPMTGRARVVRRLSETEAAPRGLLAGYGLAILDMAEPDRRQWSAFLDRVRRRTEKRVLVGASPTRLEELTAGLTAAGYTVTAGSDPGVLVRLADLEPRPPDAAVIDVSLSTLGPGNWLEHVFTARQVPCVTVRGDGRRTRAVVDRLLQVAA
jgi:hypothetical protein